MKSFKQSLGRYENVQIGKQEIMESLHKDPMLEDLDDVHIEAIASQIIDTASKRIEAIVYQIWACPVLGVAGFDCSKSGCKKDGESCCRNMEHFSCPAFNKYDMFMRRLKIERALDSRKANKRDT